MKVEEDVTCATKVFGLIRAYPFDPDSAGSELLIRRIPPFDFGRAFADLALEFCVEQIELVDQCFIKDIPAADRFEEPLRTTRSGGER